MPLISSEMRVGVLHRTRLAMRSGWAAASSSPMIPPEDSPTQCTRDRDIASSTARIWASIFVGREAIALGGNVGQRRNRPGPADRSAGFRRSAEPSGSRMPHCGRSRASSAPASASPTATDSRRRHSAERALRGGGSVRRINGTPSAGDSCAAISARPALATVFAGPSGPSDWPIA